ncbi:MAG: nucleotidyltransferase domain-containing protein [Nanoarchaeota archaeon]|nr:nucleotidyltransferase domain-containing protein [Nanoarchaeota archaeon]
MDILKEVLSKIKPEGKDKRINEFVKELQKRVGKKAEVFIGGSFAKGTYLKDNYDIDVFVRFYKEGKISDVLEKCLKGLDYEKIHGSRDYFQIKNDFNFEIVPVLRINKPEDAINVTDMSPLHVNWVNKNGKNLKDDIRLLKQFCKACKVYGAESYIKGFSGHVVDILVINYGGFEKVLKASLKWKKKEVIDYYNYHKGKVMWNMNKSKLNSPLIVVDPVLPSRNAAAALSDEKLNMFVDSAKKFLKEKDKKFFVVEKFNVEKFKGLVLEFESLKGKKESKILYMKEDVVGAKILKAYEFISKALVEFKVIDSGWDFEYMWFKVKNNEIEKEFERIGPDVGMKDAVKKFKLKHKTYVKDGKVCCKIEREFIMVDCMIKDLIKKKYVKERVKCIKLLN